jgi:tetratricopeptide (TPR) repeat protein
VEKEKSYKTSGPVLFVGLMVLMGIFCFAAWFVLQDRRYSSGEADFRMLAGPHSGSFYAELAKYGQYQPHQPSEIDRLFQLAAIRSPADSKNFAAYFEYLYARNCCLQKEAKLIQAALNRSPTSFRFYPLTVEYLLKTGEKEKAFQYFQKAVQMDPRKFRRLLPIAAENNVSAEEIIRLTPKNVEGLSALAEYLAHQGPSYRDQWLRTIEEIHSMHVQPMYLLKTAEQALRMGEKTLAKKYANLALNHPETANRAKKLLTKIDRRKRRDY